MSIDRVMQRGMKPILEFMNTTLLTMALVVLATGCNGDGKVRVSGTVTLDGNPVPNGSISFESADGGPGVGSGGIVDGAYDLRTFPGSKKVRIIAYRSSGGQLGHMAGFENYIPRRYNDKTMLIREVSPEGNQIDFDLKTE